MKNFILGIITAIIAIFTGREIYKKGFNSGVDSCAQIMANNSTDPEAVMDAYQKRKKANK